VAKTTIPNYDDTSTTSIDPKANVTTTSVSPKIDVTTTSVNSKTDVSAKILQKSDISTSYPDIFQKCKHNI
jgi:hypothetical protein